jgi:hypothetical protein
MSSTSGRFFSVAACLESVDFWLDALLFADLDAVLALAMGGYLNGSLSCVA